MIYFIENDYLKVGIKDFGSELTSIVSKENGREYLWQGNSKIWTGQSPVLFPIIGRLIDDKYTFNGKEYEMPKHGFARKMPWRFHTKAVDSISFILSETDETLKVYPFCFDLIVTFTLNGRRLTVKHEVLNKTDGKMYFSLGAHPAFNCDIGDRLVFDEDENLDTIKIDLEQSLRLPEATPFLRNEKIITVTKDVFNKDALIFSGVKSESITLESDNRSDKIIFNLGKSPYLGIWAKPGAPYVCIEPWFGVNDSQIKKDDFSQKDGIQILERNEKFTFCWSAEFNA